MNVPKEIIQVAAAFLPGVPENDYERHLHENTARAMLTAALPHIATWIAIRATPLLEAAWDEGNAMGLDGWTGPERGTEPDQHAIHRRERTVDRLTDQLRDRIAGGSRSGGAQ